MTPGAEIDVASGVILQIVRRTTPKIRTAIVFQKGTVGDCMRFYVTLF